MTTTPGTEVLNVNFGDLSMYVNKNTSGQRKNKLICISLLGSRCASIHCRWLNNHAVSPICINCALKHSSKEEIPGILGAPQRIQVGRPKRWVETVEVFAGGYKLFPCCECGGQIFISPYGQQAIRAPTSVGCMDIRALQFDHVHGGGCQDLVTGNARYSKVKTELCGGSKEWQLLCANCQWIKRSENEEAKGQKQHKRR